MFKGCSYTTNFSMYLFCCFLLLVTSVPSLLFVSFLSVIINFLSFLPISLCVLLLSPFCTSSFSFPKDLQFTIILPVVLYGCESWSLTLREERRLRVFENTVLGRVFGPKRDEVTGEWRKLHNEELSDSYPILYGG